jgi:hypothetical protein
VSTWDDVSAAFQNFTARVDAAADVAGVVIQTFTWDQLTTNRTPREAMEHIRAKATELENKLNARKR